MRRVFGEHVIDPSVPPDHFHAGVACLGHHRGLVDDVVRQCALRDVAGTEAMGSYPCGVHPGAAQPSSEFVRARRFSDPGATRGHAGRPP